MLAEMYWFDLSLSNERNSALLVSSTEVELCFAHTVKVLRRTDEIGGKAPCSTGSDATLQARKCLSTPHYGKHPPEDYHSISKNRNQEHSAIKKR